MRRVWLLGLLGGGVAAAAYLAVPSGTPQVILYDAPGILAVAAILVGIRIYRPSRRWPWLCLALGIGLWTVGEILWTTYPYLFGHDAGYFSLADVAYLAAYPAIVVAGLGFARSDPRRSAFALIDAAVATCGIALLVWDVALHDGLSGSAPLAGRLMAAAYPLLDVLVLSLMIRLSLTSAIREPAFRLLLAGFSLYFLADFAYAMLAQTDGYVDGGILDLGWILGYTLIGVAALHPSMARLTEARAPSSRLGIGRMVLLGTALIVVPVASLLRSDIDRIDVVVRSSLELLLAVLVITRLALSTRELERRNREAHRNEVRYRQLFSNSPVGVINVSLGATIVEVNRAAEELFGFGPGEMVGLPVGVIAPDAEQAARITARLRTLWNGESDAYDVEAQYRRRDGSVFWGRVRVTLALDDRGGPAFTTAIIEDVTDAHLHEEELRFRALHDPLTGLANRALLMDRLESALARSLRTGARVGVAFMDLDGFKDVNDRLGHVAGDEVLRAVADRLRTATRRGDSIARFGGDEFVVLFEEAGSPDVLAQAAERLRTAVSAPIELDSGRVLVDASVGAVLSVDPDADADDLLRRADAAMYEEKRRLVRRRGRDASDELPGASSVSEPVPSDW